MSKKNLAHLFFFFITFLILIFISVKQVVVQKNYIPFSYKQLLNPKLFFKNFSQIKNNKEYDVSLTEVKEFRKNLNSMVEGFNFDYSFIHVINESSDQEKIYFGGSNDYKTWDLNELNLKTKKNQRLISNINYPSKDFITTYQSIFKMIAYPDCTREGCSITLFDLIEKKEIKIVPTITSFSPDKKAIDISQFFYDETANLVGYKNNSIEDNKFYTLDLNVSSPAESLLQLVYLETAGKNFEFLFYYPESKMMLFKSNKKEDSTTNHPQIEYFLYSSNKPSLVILDNKNFK